VTRWVRVDCHVHTVASGDSVLHADELLERARAAGVDVVFVTDHHAVTEAQRLAVVSNQRPRVIVGEEIRTPAGELLGLFLTERIPYVLPVDEVIDRIHAQGGLVCLPHPYDPVRASVAAIADRLCESGRVDAVEVFNAKAGTPDVNERASELARRHGLPGTAGSDAHDPDGVGAAYLEMPDFRTPEEFLAGLSHAKVVGTLRPHARRFLPRALGEA
jgi:predicted metal-dependent phosphoesterase TrpH